MLDKTNEEVLNKNTKSRWDQTRCALFGFLVGQGWDAKRIADHPLIRSTNNNVHRQAQRFGLSFREVSNNNLLKLNKEHREVFEQAGLKRGLTYELFIQYILMTLAKEPTLIDNILDDGE